MEMKVEVVEGLRFGNVQRRGVEFGKLRNATAQKE